MLKLKPLKITSGTMEAVKWLALISMTIDHINRFFFKGSLYPAYCAGRLAMPLFAFMLAYSFAQPGARSRGLYPRVLMRLAIFGALATPAYMAMRHLDSLLPLNIMFLLALAVAIFYNLEEESPGNRLIALVIFLIGGFFVEYDWVGILFCLTSWQYCRKPTFLHALGWLIAFFLLDYLNGNYWALLCLPIIYLATKIDIKIPRIRYLFYVFYPLHLTVLYFLAKFY